MEYRQTSFISFNMFVYWSLLKGNGDGLLSSCGCFVSDSTMVVEELDERKIDAEAVGSVDVVVNEIDVFNFIGVVVDVVEVIGVVDETGRGDVLMKDMLTSSSGI